MQTELEKRLKKEYDDLLRDIDDAIRTLNKARAIIVEPKRASIMPALEYLTEAGGNIRCAEETMQHMAGISIGYEIRVQETLPT